MAVYGEHHLKEAKELQQHRLPMHSSKLNVQTDRTTWGD